MKETRMEIAKYEEAVRAEEELYNKLKRDFVKYQTVQKELRSHAIAREKQKGQKLIETITKKVTIYKEKIQTLVEQEKELQLKIVAIKNKMSKFGSSEAAIKAIRRAANNIRARSHWLAKEIEEAKSKIKMQCESHGTPGPAQRIRCRTMEAELKKLTETMTGLQTSIETKHAEIMSHIANN